MSDNIQQDYSITNHSASYDTYREDSNATFTFVFSSNPSNTQTLTLTSSDGTAERYEFLNNTGDVQAGNSAVAIDGFSAHTTYANFKTAVEGGVHSGKLTVTLDAQAVIITQTVAGQAGNTVVPEDALTNALFDRDPQGNYTVAAGNDPPPIRRFSGGTARLASVPFRIGAFGAPNLRTQSTTNHYETFIGEEKL